MSENTFTPAAEPQDVASFESMEASAAAVSTSPLTTSEHPSAKVEPGPASAPAKVAAPTLPTPPQHAGVTVDQRAYQQYQSLAQVVLDSADLATQSAEADQPCGRGLAREAKPWSAHCKEANNC